MPFQQGELIQSISFNAIKTHAIEGANHVTYVHNGGHEFAEVSSILVQNARTCFVPNFCACW